MRKVLLPWIVCSAVLVCAAGVSAGAPGADDAKPVERPPVNMPDEVFDAPLIVIYGDSIRGSYIGHLRRTLGKQKAAVVGYNSSNGGNSDRLVQNVQECLIDPKPDIVYFNCGLHDVKLWHRNGQLAVPIERYEQNLLKVIGLLKERTNARLVFALTTPVVEARCNASGKTFDRYNRNIDACNAVARRIMEANGVAVHDLNRVLAEAGPEECLKEDGVHPNGKGIRVLSEAVLSFLRGVLQDMDQ